MNNFEMMRGEVTLTGATKTVVYEVQEANIVHLIWHLLHAAPLHYLFEKPDLSHLIYTPDANESSYLLHEPLLVACQSHGHNKTSAC